MCTFLGSVHLLGNIRFHVSNTQLTSTNPIESFGKWNYKLLSLNWVGYTQKKLARKLKREVDWKVTVSMSVLKLKAVSEPTSTNPNDVAKKKQTFDLGNGSHVIYIQRLIPFDQSWEWFHYLDKQIPWTRPTIRVFGKSCVQVSLSIELDLIFVGLTREF